MGPDSNLRQFKLLECRDFKFVWADYALDGPSLVDSDNPTADISESLQGLLMGKAKMVPSS